MTTNRLARLLQRNENRFKTDNLAKMRKEGLLGYLYPKVINRPMQTYVITEQGK